MARYQHLSIILVSAVALIAVSAGPAGADHLPTQGDVTHLDLNTPGAFTTVGPDVHMDFTDSLDSEALWLWQVEIRNPEFRTIGIGAKFSFPGGGSPVEGNLVMTAFGSVTFDILVDESPSELGNWTFAAANDTVAFEIDSAVTEDVTAGSGSAGEYNLQFVEGGWGLGNFTPGQFQTFLSFELVPEPGSLALVIALTGIWRVGRTKRRGA